MIVASAFGVDVAGLLGIDLNRVVWAILGILFAVAGALMWLRPEWFLPPEPDEATPTGALVEGMVMGRPLEGLFGWLGRVLPPRVAIRLFGSVEFAYAFICLIGVLHPEVATGAVSALGSLEQILMLLFYVLLTLLTLAAIVHASLIAESLEPGRQRASSFSGWSSWGSAVRPASWTAS